MPSRQRSLQIREDPAFQHRQWRVQRVGWLTIGLLLVLALAGVFGKGPASHAHVRK